MPDEYMLSGIDNILTASVHAHETQDSLPFS